MVPCAAENCSDLSKKLVRHCLTLVAGTKKGFGLWYDVLLDAFCPWRPSPQPPRWHDARRPSASAQDPSHPTQAARRGPQQLVGHLLDTVSLNTIEHLLRHVQLQHHSNPSDPASTFTIVVGDVDAQWPHAVGDQGQGPVPSACRARRGSSMQVWTTASPRIIRLSKIW